MPKAASRAAESLGADAPVHPVDRVDAQLLVDELGDVRHRQFGVGVDAAGGSANLVTVRAADRVAMMAVGDQHGVGGNGGADRRDALGIGDSFDEMNDAFLVDAPPDRLARIARAVR